MPDFSTFTRVGGRSEYGRDSQRSKLYAAENAFFASLPASHPARAALPDVADVERFVARITARQWYRKHFPGHRTVRIKDGRGSRGAHAGGRTITMSRSSRIAWIVVHELAHIVTPTDPGHGWRYAAAYLALVGNVFGRDVRDGLRLAFKRGRVRYTKPRTVTPAPTSTTHATADAARPSGIAAQPPDERRRNLLKGRLTIERRNLVRHDERVADERKSLAFLIETKMHSPSSIENKRREVLDVEAKRDACAARIADIEAKLGITPPIDTPAAAAALVADAAAALAPLPEPGAALLAAATSTTPEPDLAAVVERLRSAAAALTDAADMLDTIRHRTAPTSTASPA